MKKCLLFIVWLVSISSYASPDDYYWFVLNGISYMVDHGKEVYVVSQENGTYKGDISIPEKVIFPSYKINDYIPGYEEPTYKYPSAEVPVVGVCAGAFSDCNELISIFIPKTVEKISLAAFVGCKSLERITVDIDNKVYDSRNNCNAIIESATNALIAGCKNTVIPNDVVMICGGRGPCLPQVPYEEGGYSYGAFRDCSDIVSITIPNSVVSIGQGAFSGCKNLTDIFCYTEIIPGEDAFKDDIFYDFTFLNNTTLHVHGLLIEEFKKDWNGFKAYADLDNTDFNLVYYVDEEEYKKVQYKYNEIITPEPEPYRKGMTFSGWSEIPEAMPAHDVTVTGTFSWSKLTKDKVIYEVTDTLNNHCKVIGNDNVSGEIKIESVEIDGCYYQPTEIADKAFYCCKNITKIEIPATVTTIGERAFANIDKLTDVTIWAEKVPATDRTAFENSYIDYATLQVPVSALEKYKSTAPWSGFKSVVAIGGTEPKQKCATPTIDYKNGYFFFDCETEGVEYNYNITVADAKEGKAEAVKINFMYKMTVYASKEGYEDSDVAVYEFDIRGKKGDVNADGEVNVGDLVTTTNIMMGKDE